MKRVFDFVKIKQTNIEAYAIYLIFKNFAKARKITISKCGQTKA